MMAEAKKSEKKKLLERKYVIPLRKECNKVPYYKKAGKCIKAIKKFLRRHMKVKDAKIGEHLNKFIHKHGRTNVPSRVEVNVAKFEDKEKGLFAIAELIGFPLEKEEKPKEKKKPKEEKKEEKKEHKEEEAVEGLEEEKKKVLEKTLKKEKGRGESFTPKGMKKQTQKFRSEGIVTRTGKA